jgi:cytidylate kinase
MNATNPVVDQRLQLLSRHWRHSASQLANAPRQADERRFTIAISREAGAPGREVGDQIGARLGWPVYDREVIDMISKESGLRRELLESVDEHDRGWLVDAIESLKRRDRVNSTEFVHHLVNVLTSLAAHGSCVIVGRGAAACLPRSSTLRVRIVADLGERVAHAAAEFGLTEDEAYDAVQRVDRERARFIANHFHRDIDDAHNFDLVMNASRLPPAACAELAVAALRARVAAAAPKDA